MNLGPERQELIPDSIAWGVTGSIATTRWTDGKLVHRRITPQRYPFIHLGEERQIGEKFLV